MNRRLAIAAIAIIIFVGAAWLLWSQLFAEENVENAPPPADAAPQVVQYDAEPKVEPVAPGVRISSAEGTVEVAQADGTWKPLEAGQEVSLGDQIRTGEDSKAVIDIAGTMVEIGESGTLTVPEFRRVDLGDGQVTAKVDDSDEAFVVGTEGSDATAASTDGEFAVISDGKGGMAVASTVGKTVFAKAGKSVEVPEGSVSQASADSAPSAPKAIPTSLFLKVAKPGKTIKKKRFTLRGESSPGTTIRVNGEIVRVGDDGTFQHVVALSEGQNKVVVASRDVLGRKKAESINVKVDSKGPAIDGKLTW